MAEEETVEDERAEALEWLRCLVALAEAGMSDEHATAGARAFIDKIDRAAS